MPELRRTAPKMGTLLVLVTLGSGVSAQPVAAPGLLPAEPTNDTVWRTLFTQVQSLYEQGHYEAGAVLALEARREAERFGSEGVRVGSTLNYMGLLYYALGRHSDAERAYVAALRIIERDPTKRLELVALLTSLASLYMADGARYSQAERLMCRILELTMTLQGSDHPDVGVLLSNLATAHLIQRHDSETEVLLNRALTILEKSPVSYQSFTAGALSNLGVLLTRQGNPEGALPYWLRAIPLFEQTLGPSHPDLIWPLINLGRAYLLLKRASMAEEALHRAVAIAEPLGHEHPILREALSSYAIALRKNGKKKEGREIEARAKALGADGAFPLAVHVSELMSPRRGVKH